MSRTFVAVKSLNGYLANSEGLYEIPLYGAFYQGLHCLLRQNRSSEKTIKYVFGNYNL